jgi:large subunit ribosomal protein L23
MKPAYEVLKTIRLTEKSNKQSSEFGQYTSMCSRSQCSTSVPPSSHLKVGVKRGVNIINVKGKLKRGRNGRPTTAPTQEGHRHPQEGRQDRARLSRLPETPPCLSRHSDPSPRLSAT